MFLCFQDFPYIPIVVLMVLFSLLRMAEICESPFDYDNYYDVHIKEEIDIQLFIGSLALYQDTPPILKNWKGELHYQWNQQIWTLYYEVHDPLLSHIFPDSGWTEQIDWLLCDFLK